MNLRNKILLLPLSLILLLGVLTIFVIKTTLTKTLMSELTERAVFVTKYLAQESADDLLTENRFGLRLRINNFMKDNHDINYIFILDAKEKVIAHTFQNGFPVELLDKGYKVASKEGYSIRKLKTEEGNI